MKEVNQILDKYIQICQKAGVFTEGHYVEMNSIKKGIVDFILKNNVRKLVMGAAADKQFSKRMVDVSSKKAGYVKLKAAAFCEIQFIYKGNIIFTRQGTLDGVDFSTASTSAHQIQLQQLTIVESLSEVSEVQSDYAAVSIFKEEVQNPPPSSVIVFEERGMHDELYDQLEQAMTEADTYKRDAFEESIR
nr:U-box domain-containing protein kinase family protein [Tanacetum cinerariifolium]